jgi:hypothetical protein
MSADRNALELREKYMGIPTNLQADVARLFAAHGSSPAQVEIDRSLGGYTDGVTSDGSQFIAICMFAVQEETLQFLHITNLMSRVVPLGTAPSNCPMDVFGFSSNTTNANWTHDQNNTLALHRMDLTAQELIKLGVPATLVSEDFDSGEIGPEDLETQTERFSMVVVTLNGATPPPPLANP